MAIYINDNNKIIDIFINPDGQKRKVKSIWCDKNGSATKVFPSDGVKSIKIVTWASGTDEEIVAMLDAHYAGEINIYDYWHVGDERIVHLSEMESGAVDDMHVAQDVTMVLMHKGSKTLTTQINGKTKCAFIVGQKNCLANGTVLEGGYMNSENTNNGGWDGCVRRTWCNNTYRNAFPESFRALFKQVNNVTANGTGAEKITSIDYFALPSEMEIFGEITFANETAEEDNSQFDYYKISANRKKTTGDGGSLCYWWMRSPNSSGTLYFCDYNGDRGSKYYASRRIGIAPFGCI